MKISLVGAVIVHIGKRKSDQVRKWRKIAAFKGTCRANQISSITSENGFGLATTWSTRCYSVKSGFCKIENSFDPMAQIQPVWCRFVSKLKFCWCRFDFSTSKSTTIAADGGIGCTMSKYMSVVIYTVSRAFGDASGRHTRNDVGMHK